MLAFYGLFEQCEQAVENSETWLKVQVPPASEPEPLKVQLDRCQVSSPFFFFFADLADSNVNIASQLSSLIGFCLWSG